MICFSHLFHFTEDKGNWEKNGKCDFFSLVFQIKIRNYLVSRIQIRIWILPFYKPNYEISFENILQSEHICHDYTLITWKIKSLRFQPLGVFFWTKIDTFFAISSLQTDPESGSRSLSEIPDFDSEDLDPNP